jgi:hypothetical protein
MRLTRLATRNPNKRIVEAASTASPSDAPLMFKIPKRDMKAKNGYRRW